MTAPLEPGPLDGDGAVYEQIKRAVARPILSGQWLPGARLPSEHELTRRFGTSRMTVNRALTALAEEGLIHRRRRAGSFVASPTAQHPVLEINDIKADVLATGRAYRFEVGSRVVRLADAADMARLGLERPTTVLAVQVCHFAAGVPFAYEDRLINLRAVPAAERELFAETPPGTWLLDHVPWTEAVHSIRAVAADRVVAGQLDLAEGAPCLMVERRTRRAAEPITAVRVHYPGDRHELVAHFSPRGQVGRSQGHRDAGEGPANSRDRG